MELVLAPGDKIRVTLKDTDGEFVLEYGKTSLKITTDFPDSNGRKGIIYEEKFGKPETEKKVSWPSPNGKLIPTSRGVRAYEDFVGASLFLAKRPEVIALNGLPEPGVLSDAPANTILVLFKGRITRNGTPPSTAHVYVKSAANWWPNPVNEPHNCWGQGAIYDFIRREEYGHALYYPDGWR